MILLDAGLDEARYAAYLRAMLGLVAPLEAALDRVPGLRAVWPDLEQRHKTHLLRADLQDLPAADGREVAAADALLPALATVGAALGVGYVLEGSTLGGAVLARGVKERLGGVPTRYFECYGDALGPRWRSFLGYLEGASLPAEGNAAIVTAAVETFAAVEARFAAGGLLR
jgi:heme oxygenase